MVTCTKYGLLLVGSTILGVTVLTTGIFFLNLLEGLRPGIVDPNMIVNVNETGEYEDRRQNGELQYLQTETPQYI